MVNPRAGRKPHTPHRPTIEACEPRRLLAYSFIDPTFGNAVGPSLIGTSPSRVAARPDGLTLFATVRPGILYVGRLLPDGKSLDPDFGDDGVIGLTGPSSGDTPILSDLAVLSNGDLRLSASSGGTVRVYALTVSGELDSSFGVGGFRDVSYPGASLEAHGLAIGAGGTIYIAGSASTGLNALDSMIARLNKDGDLDPEFGGGVRVINRSTDLSGPGYDYFSDVVVLADGTPVAFGFTHHPNGIARLARFGPTGILDPAWPASPTLGPVGGVNQIGDMALDSLQRLYIAIERNSAGGTTLIRLNSSTGSLDTSYGGQGYSAAPAFNSNEYFTHQFALAPDGSAFTLANYFEKRMGVITALNPDGGLVQPFGNGGHYRYTPAEFGNGSGAFRGIAFQDANHVVVSGAASGGDQVFVDRILVADTEGFYTTATGKIFADRNGNGLRDTDEPYVSGTAFDDDNANGRLDANERYDGSNATTGEFELTNLSAGPHRLTLVIDPESQQMTVAPPGGYTFETTTGGTIGPFDFGLYSLTGVRGYVWEDLNLSQTQGPGEPLISGRTIYLDLDEDNVLDENEPSDVTDVVGEFSIEGVEPGRYVLRHIVPTGWLEYTRSLSPRRIDVIANSFTVIGIGTYRPAVTPPKITFSAFDYDNNLGTFFDLFFSETVDATLTINDLVITNTATNAPLPAQYKRIELLPAPGKTYARLWFEPLIPDGRYRLDLTANAIADLQGASMTAAFTSSFAYLHGDVTLDGVVNFNDLLSMAQRYGSSGRTYREGNLDRDPLGLVDFNDLLILAQTYRNALSVVTATTTRRRAGIASELLA